MHSLTTSSKLFDLQLETQRLSRNGSEYRVYIIIQVESSDEASKMRESIDNKRKLQRNQCYPNEMINFTRKRLSTNLQKNKINQLISLDPFLFQSLDSIDLGLEVLDDNRVVSDTGDIELCADTTQRKDIRRGKTIRVANQKLINGTRTAFEIETDR